MCLFYEISVKLVISLSESYQEIQSTLTEMESCMSLLLPEFNLTDNPTTSSSPSNIQPADDCPSAGEQPCCSKDVRDDWREGMIQEREEGLEEKKRNPEEKRGKEEKGMTGDKRIHREEIKEKEVKESSEDEIREDNERREEKGKKKTQKGEDKKVQMVTTQREGMEEEEDCEEEEEENSEEEEDADEEDLFIRNSGLISHSYSLDLNISPGGCN